MSEPRHGETPGEYLARIIKRRGLTPNRLAAMSNGEVDQSTVRHYITGLRNPSRGELAIVARTLGEPDGPNLLRAYGFGDMIKHLSFDGPAPEPEVSRPEVSDPADEVSDPADVVAREYERNTAGMETYTLEYQSHEPLTRRQELFVKGMIATLQLYDVTHDRELPETEEP